jgi:uncharacterized protein (DUF305 family)
MALITCLGHQRSFVLINLTLILAMTGVPTYQRTNNASQPSTSPAWPELQQSMQTMHQAMSSIQSTGSDDKDFIRLMIPHHQAAIDMAKAELIHGQDPQVRRLAQEIITDQESEIELMQLWLRQHSSQEPKPATSAAKEQ